MKTAGIDGVKSLSPHARLVLVTQLKVTGKPKPTRRVWIDKPGKVEKRPLGIPTMVDRALQALVKLALEPEWEAKFEGNSFGFRPGRSAHDAVDAIFKNVSLKAKYVLDADISQCFDRIDHKALLNKLNTFPTLRKQIKAWLKSGVMDKGVFSDTKEGTPQGGVISPLLANIALHGFEEFITSFYTITKGIVSTTGRKSTRRVKPALVRYADDFVILHESEEFITLLRQKADEWLKDMGLELKPSKTRICHTSEGFDFLGFNVRQYKTGAYRAATYAKGNQYSSGKEVINLGFTTLIKPTKESVKRHLDKIGQVIDKHHNAPQLALISRLNPVIRGWCNYYASVVSKETFNKCDHLTYQKLLAWAKSRCTKTNAHDTVSNYWRTVGEDNWTFATSGGTALVKHSSTTIDLSLIEKLWDDERIIKNSVHLIMTSPLARIESYPQEAKRLIGIDYEQFLALVDLAEQRHLEKQAEIEKTKVRIIASGGGRKPEMSQKLGVCLCLVDLGVSLPTFYQCFSALP